jgi:hypothetical protein
VFLCYASQEGAAFIDRALYLPREWTGDPRRLSEAGVPKGVRFATKGELAKVMLGRAFEAGVPARWIVADTVYGMTRGLRGWLEKRERSYVLAVTSSKGIYYEGRQRQVRKVAQSLSEESWMRASAGSGSKGERLYDWACLTLPHSEAYDDGVGSPVRRWLLMRRSIEEREQIAYYLCYGPAHTSVHELIRIAGRRWVIEDSFEAAKGEVGLDEYEVRKWDGWQRHITLCLLAHAYLGVVRSVAAAEEDGAKGGDLDSGFYPELIPPTVPEVKRLIRAMMGPEEQREFRLGWSLFRRAHQAVAKRSHKASRTNKHATDLHAGEHDAGRRGGGRDPARSGATAAPRALTRAPKAGLLADEQWERVRALLPTQKSGQGRPRRDDRQVLCAILWVMDSGSSWRDLPEEEFGPNSTAHGRSRKWCKEGLWSRIVEALGR